MSETARDPAIGLEAADIDALINARHPDPFSRLGLQQTARAQVVRALLPGARRVEVVGRGGRWLGELTQIHSAGLFAGPIDNPRAADLPYRLRIDWHGVVQETEDAYGFGVVLPEAALQRLSQGDPAAALECLGAHLGEMDEVPGVRFAVWAPNARRVSVVGDFNSWDGRRHPMRLRHAHGVWEIFLPHVGPGMRYKYQIVARDGHILPLKADPCAWQTELPPGTASIVARSNAFAWTDETWMRARGAKQSARAPISIYEVHAES